MLHALAGTCFGAIVRQRAWALVVGEVGGTLEGKHVLFSQKINRQERDLSCLGTSPNL